jgi:glutamate carboxypeptidase
MLTTANPFDSKIILDGIRRWVEIETPTEAPDRVNKLATLVANGHRVLNVTSRTERVHVKVTGELNRPPYEKSNAGAALYEHARALAAEIGFELSDTFTGGGSDGNFTAPHTATLDGLGVDGKGAHIHFEQMYISSIEPRARLLRRLYRTLR